MLIPIHKGWIVKAVNGLPVQALPCRHPKAGDFLMRDYLYLLDPFLKDRTKIRINLTPQEAIRAGL